MITAQFALIQLPSPTAISPLLNLSLSNTWYTTSGKGNATESDINFISKFIEYFARKCDVDYKQIMYTFPKYRRWDSVATRGGIKRKVIKEYGKYTDDPNSVQYGQNNINTGS